MIHRINKIERPPREVVDRFRGIGTATVHEASGRKGYVDCAIKPIAKGVRICGPAFTVQCHPRDNLMLHKALERAQPGDILVASVGGYYEAGYWGGLMATSAMGRKIGGLAIDGCVRFEEFRFGDNDNLSAMVANLVDADLLAMLTDIGGLYTADPHCHPEAQLIRRVDAVDVDIERMACDTAGREGAGGMMTKIEAAKLAISSGVNVVIACGRQPDVLVRISKGEEIGTFFPAQVSKMESRKRWMLSGLASKGKVTVDKGAASALKEHNRSLLPAGVMKAEGKFQRGDIVDILSEKGKRIGCGISNYGSSDLATIGGKHSDTIGSQLGYDYGDEVIHRNNMVIL